MLCVVSRWLYYNYFLFLVKILINSADFPTFPI